MEVFELDSWPCMAYCHAGRRVGMYRVNDRIECMGIYR
jgi:hypothetical protein